MGAVKALYTASLEYDRDTGASLCARPEYALKDHERGRNWLRDGRKPDGHVRASYRKAKGMEENERRGRVTYMGDREYMYTVESTAAYAYRTKGVPMKENDADWYNGALRIEEDGERIQACQCSCPAWERGYAVHRGMKVCKHVIWAWERARKGNANYAEQDTNFQLGARR